MTESEAIEEFKERLELIEKCYRGEVEDYKQALELGVKALEKQIPKKPYKDNENGVYEKDYCPTCHRSLFPNDHHCECGQKIDWSDDNGD